MDDGNAFVYTERDMREIIQAERDQIVTGISDLRRRMSATGCSDQTVLALYDAAVIAQNGGK